MLVLSRRPDEAIVIGQDVEVRILAVDGDQVKLGISAPRSVAVHRAEVYAAIQEANRAAAAARVPDPAALHKFFTDPPSA